MFLKQWRAVIAPIFSGAKLGKYFCIHKRAAAHSQHRGTFNLFSQGFVSELITDGEVPSLVFIDQPKSCAPATLRRPR